MFEEQQPDGSIPGSRIPGEGMGLAGQAAKPVAQHAIEPLDMHRVGVVDRCAKGGPHLNVVEAATTPMLRPRQ